MTESTTMQPRNYLAIDLGAESGRAILGALDGERLALSEIHRFGNGPISLPDGLHWDILRLWTEIKAGIGAAVRKHEKKLAAIGLDTWGVDFALLDKQGVLIGNPYHYRDRRTDGMLDEAFRRVPREQIFEATGIQFMQLNSLYQLLAMLVSDSPALKIAATFLTIPDLLNYWMSGRAACEFTIATTTQCFDPRQRDWACSLLERLSLPTHIFPEVVQPGTVLGDVLSEVADETGCGRAPIVAPACHDTGSAVVAVPAESDRFAWISSGTWSIVGTEAREPVINEQVLTHNLTNEGGVDGTWRLSKNIIGLWLAQECRRTWAREGDELSYDDLTRLAAQAEPFVAVVDPDHDDFLHPGDMPARIRAYCRRTGQRAPDGKGALVRCALESLALKYRWVLERLEDIVGHRLEPVHIIGGGTQNQLLSQFAADATGRRVVTGPVEATAIGNILMQAIATGQLASLAEARAVVRRSFAPKVYEPGDRSGWDAAYQQLLEVA